MTYTTEVARDSLENVEALAKKMRLIDGVDQVKPTGSDNIEICIKKNSNESINQILQTTMDQRCRILSLAQREIGLEEAIMKLVREGIND